MCAALLGLIAVCSTMVFSRGRPTSAAAVAGVRAERAAQECGAIEEDVHIAVGGGVEPRDTRDVRQRRDEVLRDGARGLAQVARQLEGDRTGQVAQRTAGRLLQDDGRQGGGIQPEAGGQRVAKGRANGRVKGQQHGAWCRIRSRQRAVLRVEGVSASTSSRFDWAGSLRYDAPHYARSASAQARS